MPERMSQPYAAILFTCVRSTFLKKLKNKQTGKEGQGEREKESKEEQKDPLATALARKSSRNPGCITQVLDMALSWTTLLPECLLSANI